MKAATRSTSGRSVAPSALRASGAGCTLVVSPLLALMRDQIAAADRAGLRGPQPCAVGSSEGMLMPRP